MTNAKATKRALLSSALALFLCFAMLIGTTFAWFTDKVESKNNIIKAGNLDIELKYAKIDGDKLTDWDTVGGKDNIFDKNALWEPGRVEVVYLEVSNLGSLALKYQLGVNVVNEITGKNVAGEDFKLSDHLVFKVVKLDAKPATPYTREEAIAAAGTTKGLKDYNGATTPLEVGGTDYVALIVYMPETVGNEANYRGDAVPTIELGINLYATQQAAEQDSFGSDYDEDAWGEGFKVTTAGDLQAAINNGVTNIVLTNDITLSESIVIPAPGATTVNVATTAEANTNAVVIDLNGKEITGNVPKSVGHVIYNNGALILKNGTVSSTADNGGSAIYNAAGATLTLEDVVLNGAPQSGSVSSFWPSYAINSYGELTINGAEITSNHGALALYGDTVINDANVTMNGIGGSSHVFYIGGEGTEVTINGGTYTHKGNVDGSLAYIMTGSSVIVNGGSFSASNGGYGMATYTGSLTVNGGYFANAFLDWGGPIAIAGGTFAAKPADKYIADGFKAYQNAEGLWAVAHEDYEGFVADGVLADANKTTYGITNVNGYAWVEAQEDNFFAGKTITLENDIDFGGATIAAIRFWNPESKTVFDGQGFTLSNFVIENTSGNAGLFNGTLNIKNVNVEGATVTGKYAGVFAGNMYGNIDNCTVKGSTVNGTYWQTGVLAGQYNAGNVTNCVVEECTINGLAAVGGLVGILNETAGERTFEDCIVKNCVINQTGSFGGNYDEMFGVAVGCINIVNSKVYFNNCTLEGNTLKGVASEELYGVEESTTTVYVNGAKAIHSAEELQKAVDVAADGATLLLVRDIIGDVKVTQKADVKFTIDGNGKTFNGVMTVFGNGRKATAALTIKNIDFVAANGASSCIVSPDRTVNNAYSYSSNVTVENCTFTDPDGVVNCAAVRHEDGGDSNWKIIDCVVDNTMHSLIQTNNVELDGLTIQGCKVYSKNGINLNQCAKVSIVDCEIDVKGYAVRYGVNGSTVNGTFEIVDSTLKSANDDGDAVIIFRGTMTGSTLTITNTTFVGTPEITGNANVVRN